MVMVKKMTTMHTPRNHTRLHTWFHSHMQVEANPAIRAQLNYHKKKKDYNTSEKNKAFCFDEHSLLFRLLYL
jgi:hypothetical protein